MGVDLLKKVHYLSHLPASALGKMMKIAKVLTFRKGDLIISKKEAAEHLFIVAQGRVKIFVAPSPRKTKTFATIEKGEFFGELALLDGTVRTASAEALEDNTRIIIVPKRDFQRFLLKDPGFMMMLLRTLAERLRRTNETIEGLLFKNLLGRVAKALVDLQERKPGNGQGLAVTHQELAAWVGTSREPLSRALSSLRRGGLIETGQGHIKISDPAKLKQLAGG
jgi:CRP/FNR family transcriptional regulator, cyclic AMP receptor protein